VKWVFETMVADDGVVLIMIALEIQGSRFGGILNSMDSKDAKIVDESTW